jgi:hypothetical protein
MTRSVAKSQGSTPEIQAALAEGLATPGVFRVPRTMLRAEARRGRRARGKMVEETLILLS